MTDVLVIGGGVIGSAAAFAIARRGMSVVIVERGRIGGEATPAAAGVLGAQLEAHQDGPLARLCLASRARYAAWVAEIGDRTGRDVDYRASGVMRVASSVEELDFIARQVTWQQRAGLTVEHLDAAAAREAEPALTPDLAGAVRFPEDSRVDPPALLDALRLAATHAGGVFHTGIAVRRVLVRSGRTVGVELDDGRSLDAGAVVIAGGSWSALLGDASLPAEAVRPARGQIIELALPAPILGNVVEGADCYLSPRDDGRVLVGSTMEFVGFRCGVTAAAVRDLLIAATRLVPALGNANVSRTWSGFRPYTADALPLLGPTPIDGLFAATGHFRNGILLAPITGDIVAALVTGAPPPVDLEPFAPRRLLRASG